MTIGVELYITNQRICLGDWCNWEFKCAIFVLNMMMNLYV